MRGGEPLPAGTVTFLFTDIEGSTKLLRRAGDAYRDLLVAHRALLRAAVGEHRGVEVDTEGDGCFFAFPDAPGAVAAAIGAQRALAAAHWPDGHTVRVRMGMHTGEATPTGDDYVALAVHQAARVAAAAHGGQILASSATVSLLAGTAPARDLGRYRLKDFDSPDNLFEIDAGTAAGAFPPIRAEPVERHNLPRDVAPFVGRADSMQTVVKALDTTRCVSIVGTGGAGKTRLAVQVARMLVDRYDDGVWLVELATIDDPALATTVVADALDVRDDGAAPLLDAVVGALAPRRLLVVLDNCEHVVAAAAELALALVQRTDGVDVLATSRRPLDIGAETVVRLAPLDVPLADADPFDALRCESMELLVDRAARHRHDFVAEPDDVPHLARICRRVDGIPLAIELAAARLRAFAPKDVADRLDDELGFLDTRRRAEPDRHGTLVATMAWSYDLLSADERVVFERCSVFRSGLSIGGAEAVCATETVSRTRVAGHLSALVDDSLLDAGVERGETRLRMLQPVQDHAAQRLAERGRGALDEARRAHALHFAALGRDAEPHLRGPRQDEWLDRLTRERDNLRVAVEHAASVDELVTVALEMVCDLELFWRYTNTSREGAALATRVLERAGAHVAPDTVARARVASGWLHLYSGQRDASHDLFARAHEAATTGDTTAAALVGRAFLRVNAGDRTAAIAMFGEAIARATTSHIVSEAQIFRAAALASEGELDAARSAAADALAAAEQTHDARGAAVAAQLLANIELIVGDVDRADALLRRSIGLGPFVEGSNVANFGTVALMRGELATAASRYREALQAAAREGMPYMTAATVMLIASLEHARGRLEHAAALLGASDAMLASRGLTVDLLEVAIRRRTFDRLQTELGPERFARAHERGAQMSWDAAVAAALDATLAAANVFAEARER